MKNLILTFVFALVSLISFTQDVSIGYVGGDSTGTIIIADSNDVINPAEDTIYVNGNVVFSGSILYIKELNSTFSDFANPYTLDEPTKTLPMNIGDEKYIKITTNVGTIGHITVIYVDPSASTSENTLTREELKVYPSPATSDIKISFSADKSDMPLNIFSLNGQLVHQDNTSREVGAINIVELNVSGWSAGIYLVNNGKETFKFVVL